MLKFHPYSILTGDTMVEFVIYCVLISVNKRKWLGSPKMSSFCQCCKVENVNPAGRWTKNSKNLSTFFVNERILWEGDVSMAFSKSQITKKSCQITSCRWVVWRIFSMSDLEKPILTFPISKYSHCRKLQNRVPIVSNSKTKPDKNTQKIRNWL